MMRTRVAGLAFAAGLVASAAAYGQVADLMRASCAQLLELPRNDRGQLIVWLHGYYAGAAQRPVIDRTKLDHALAAIQQACDRNRAMALIGMEARAIFLGEPLPETLPAPSPPASDNQQPAPGSPRPRPVPAPLR